MAKNFSDKYLMALKPRERAYQVREAKGFTLRVLPTGTKTFLFIYEEQGKRKQLNLGVYPAVTLAEARQLYNEAVVKRIRGESLVPVPATECATEILTVGKLINLYLVKSSGDTPKWVEIKKSTLNNKLADWLDRDPAAITQTEVLALVEAEQTRTKGNARNLARIAAALFEFAVERRLITASPFYRLRKIVPNLRGKSKTRFLSEAEIKTMWKAIDAGGGKDVTKRALKLILVTAQRPGEVAGLHRREIEGDWWVLPADRNLKGNRTHRIFLTATAKALIGDGEGFIFKSPMQDSKNGYISSVALSQRVVSSKYYGVAKWTPHDLRRTARTHFSRLRVPREHAEAVLNHAKTGMVKVYDQYEFDDEKKAVLQAWETELLRLVAQS